MVKERRCEPMQFAWIASCCPMYLFATTPAYEYLDSPALPGQQERERADYPLRWSYFGDHASSMHTIALPQCQRGVDAPAVPADPLE
jgi:hypothetical protein